MQFFHYGRIQCISHYIVTLHPPGITLQLIKNSLCTHQLYALLQTGLSNKGRQTTEKEKARIRVSVSEAELPFIFKGKKKENLHTENATHSEKLYSYYQQSHTVDPRYPHRVNVLSRGTGQLQLIS